MWCWTEPQSPGGLTGLEIPGGSATCLIAGAAYHPSISASSHMATTCGLGFAQHGSWVLRGSAPGAETKAEDLLRGSLEVVCSILSLRTHQEASSDSKGWK